MNEERDESIGALDSTPPGARRDLSPSVSPADVRALVASTDAFAHDLYRAWRERPGNLFFSPYSISVALATT
jgi:serpin B